MVYSIKQRDGRITGVRPPNRRPEPTRISKRHIYGGLDTRPIEIRRAFGAAWGVGGWLVFPYLAKLGPETMERLRQRVVAELTTTFASHYAREVSLAEALDVEMIRAYGKRATGEKYLVNPNKTS
jgi:NADPH2:quinone reductase